MKPTMHDVDPAKSPTGWRRPIAALALLAALASTGAAAQTDPAPAAAAVDTGEHFALTYDLYSSGFILAGFHAEVLAWPDRYAIALDGRTRGILRLLGNWTASMQASGYIGETLRPLRWVFTARDGDGPVTRTIDYTPDGRVIATLDPPRPGLPQVPAADLAGALDPLSAVVGAGLVTRPEHCPPRQRIFDGTRAFDIAFLRIRPTRIDGSSVGGYVGPAVECEARMIPVSGHWRDPSSSSFWRYSRPDEDPGRMTMRVWFAQLAPDSASVLVRAERTGEIGNFYLHLVESRLDVLPAPAFEETAAGQ